MQKDKFVEYAIEITLEVLRLTSSQINKIKESDPIGVEILQEKVLIPYGKIYGALLEMKIESIDENELKNLENMMEEIRGKNNLSREYINTCIEKRKKLIGHSGAEVVKRFFEYNLKRLFYKKEQILETYNKLSEEEIELEKLLKDAIQEEEQFDIIYKLQPIREKLRKVEEKYISLAKDIEDNEIKLESIWHYEIYGIISEDELLQTYKKEFKMEE